MRSALLVGATHQGAGVTIGPLPNLRDAIGAIPQPAPTNLTATGAANGSASLTWTAAAGAYGYEVSRKDLHIGSWNVAGTTQNTEFSSTGLTAGRTYLYRIRTYDPAGNYSSPSNLEMATTIDYTDPVLTTLALVKAKHIIEVRTAVNAMCTYAGAAICSTLPFTGPTLDENQVKTQQITASDFIAVENQIVSIRAAIGASAASFGETPNVGVTVKKIHMEDLRKGAN
jgi:chitodextrinase